MDKKQTRQQAIESLNAGTPKSQIFASLRGGALKDRALAALLANHPDPELYTRHHWKVIGVLAIMILQGLLAAAVGFVLGASIGPTAIWLMPLAFAVIPFLLAYGVYRNHSSYYTVYVLLNVSQFHRAFEGFSEEPITTGIAVLIGFASLVYVLYVKSLLFPDVVFMSPKKIKGQYVFSR
ncbi:hypothetical protein [Pseudomonas sp. FEN]|uniref:hypothetical protein n=1 Tax=Pseudomonas sp. FEN TaxID=2767468 RepID=UPI00174DB453|nr:hypothetical protein [Pseudomonas sp. FEN]